MNYSFNLDDRPIVDRILEINNVEFSALDVSNFEVDYNLEVINKFKEKLLSCKDKRFLIVGDYDCDGICGTAILSKLLSDLNIQSNYYIPSRCKEGYGINNGIVNMAKENGFGAILCVDNGIIANEQLCLCKEYGIHTFVVDHHEYQNEPVCDCFLHPNLFSNQYSDMCAGGLSALLSNSFRYDDFTTCLGGLATLADMVSVFNYNRFLLKKMIEIISKGNVYPINLLLGHNEVSYENIQYNVIPKINAVSRLDDLMNVNYVVRFLLSKDEQALSYFDKIENINKARKDYTKQMVNLSERYIDVNKNVIVIRNNEFKEGLCGLLANRILASTNKPVLVFADDGMTLKGSGRAPMGTNLHDYLSHCDELFLTFGGHAGAVGLSLKNDNYDKLLAYIDAHPIRYQAQSKDVLVLNGEEVNDDLLNQIDRLRPFGVDFVEPYIGLKNIYKKKIIVSNKYPKFIINDKLSAICFNSKFIDSDFKYMIGKLKKDDYKKGNLSLIIEDLA